MTDFSNAGLVRCYRDNYEYLFGDAGFLWELRDKAVKQPHYTRSDLEALDDRIIRQVKALLTAPDLAWDLVVELLPAAQSGEIFVAAVLAFVSGDEGKIAAALAAGLADETSIRALISACGWLPGPVVHPTLKKMILADDLKQQYLAISAFGVRREDPKIWLEQILKSARSWELEELIARALRLCGELKRADLLPLVTSAMESEQKNIAFWANWSAALMGNTQAVKGLEKFVMQPGPHQKRAIEVALLGLSVEDGRAWINKLTKATDDAKSVIYATAVLGDPQAIPWLIQQMSVPACDRLAGEAFSVITGIDLLKEDLVSEKSSQSSSPEEGQDNASLEIDEQEFLPYPDVNKIRSRYQSVPCVAGQRYFMGHLLGAADLQAVYFQADQRKRALAALHLAWRDRLLILPNCAARGSNSL